METLFADHSLSEMTLDSLILTRTRLEDLNRKDIVLLDNRDRRGRHGGYACLAFVKRLNPTTVSLVDVRGTEWKLRGAGQRVDNLTPRQAAEVRSAAVAALKAKAPDTSGFRPGDKVEWTHKGRYLSGTVHRINRRTVGVMQDGNGLKWRCPPSILHKLGGTV